MSMDSFAIGIVTWLVTFAVHSTVLLGSAWLLASRLGRGAHRDEERWWKVALIAGILTASGQTALGIRPLTGEFRIPAIETTMVATAAEKPLIETPEPATLSRPAAVHRRTTTPATRKALPAVASIATMQPEHTVRTWAIRAAGLWLFCASLGLIAFFMSWSRLSRLLRHRTRLSSLDGAERGAIHQLFEELARKLGLVGKVRLSASNRLASPITFGVFRREVCLPHAAIYALDIDEQRAMLAHELAHAKRRDAAWLLSINIIERVLFFQPLLRLARRRQQHLAEYLCDDYAVSQTHDPVSLASCLTEVASWVVGQRPCRLAPSMAAAGIELDTRVRRILDAHKNPALGRLRYALLPLAIASCLGVLFGIPSVNAEPTVNEPDEPVEIHEDELRSLPSPNTDPTVKLSLALDTTSATPELMLALLDEELTLLRTQLALLRLQAADVDASERVLTVLEHVELTLQSMESRRARLAELLPHLSNITSSSAAGNR